MEKRGELTSTMIVTIVLALVGFIMIAGLILYLYTAQNPNKEVCKLSVLTRATAPPSLQAAVPLKCTTDKICITSNLIGGNCKEFLGEKGVTYVRISGTDQEKIRQIEETAANTMYDCWDMMGRGKLDLFHNAGELLGGKQAESTCVICSRVATDSSINATTILAKVNVNTYLANTVVPGQTNTYLQAFTDKQFATYNKVNDLSSFSTSTEISGAPNAGGTENREIAFVFMQIKTTSWGEALKNLGTVGATVGAATFFSPAGSILGKAIKLVGAKATLVVVAVVAVTATAVTGWNAYQSGNTAAGYCGTFASGDPNENNRAGCSLVEMINYNFNDVNSLCRSIQGNP